MIRPWGSTFLSTCRLSSIRGCTQGKSRLSSTFSDIVGIERLQVAPRVAHDAWGQSSRQPAFLSLRYNARFDDKNDSLDHPHAINYATLSDKLTESVNTEKTPLSIDAWTEKLWDAAKSELPMSLELHLPKLLLRSDGVQIYLEGGLSNVKHLIVNNYRSHCIVGLNDAERLEEQELSIDYTFSSKGTFEPWWRPLVKHLDALAKEEKALTLEYLASHLAQSALKVAQDLDSVTVSLKKPSAVPLASTPIVSVTRSRGESQTTLQGIAKSRGIQDTLVVVALGSNVGDRVGNIDRALLALHSESVRVLDTSFLYETQPQYVTDQPTFLNAAVLVRTSLEPQELLRKLKSIEHEMGRDLINGMRHGPRCIDLDILVYGDEKVHIEGEYALEIPHKGLAEREFALAPLCDVAGRSLVLPCGRCAGDLLDAVHQNIDVPAQRVYAMGKDVVPLGGDTQIMSILNVTPDSFSDGGVHFESVSAAVNAATSQLDEGALIVDVGGMSTRPGASDVLPEEERARVIPVVEKILGGHPRALVSVDTFRPGVARDTIAAGASVVNDVTGADPSYDDPECGSMLTIVRDTCTSIVLMHSQGSWQSPGSKLDASVDTLVRTLAEQMRSLVDRAIAHRVPRWHIILDPGFGFGKSMQQGEVLLKNLATLIGDPELSGYAWLIATSRKGFLGRLAHLPKGHDPVLRDPATAASSVVASQAGAQLVRVHNVPLNRDALSVVRRTAIDAED